MKFQPGALNTAEVDARAVKHEVMVVMILVVAHEVLQKVELMFGQ